MMKSRFLISVAAFAVLPFNPAAAQSTGASNPSGATAQATGEEAVQPPQAEGLQDIVVTAQRRSESLQRAAIAVTSVGGDELRAASVVSPVQLTAIVPALQIAPSNGSFNFYLRGVGNVNGNPLSESAIAFNYAGVYIGRPASTAGFFYDIERVEVLKGPQGTLYGRNATGGAINVIPKAPTNSLEGSFSLELGNYDTVNAQGAFNIPVSEGVALRVAGFTARHDGYMHDGTDDQDDAGGRVQLRIEPADNLKINILADYVHQGGTGAGSTPVALGLGNRDGLSSDAGQAFYESVPNTLGGRNFYGIPRVQYQNNTFYGVAATIDWKTSLGTLTLLPSYRHSKIDTQNSTVGFLITEKDSTKEKSLEARFASDQARSLKVLIGGYYYDADTDVPLFLVNNQFDYTRQTYKTGTTSLAAFGRVTYDVTPTFRLNGGLRYTHEKKYLDGTDLILDRICLAGMGGCPDAEPFAFGDTSAPDVTIVDGAVIPQMRSDGTLQVGTLIDVKRKAKFERVTWRAGMEWDAGPNSLLYASYETGFKSGGFFFTHDEGVYKPENIKAWTIGSKNRFLSNRLQVNLEGFWWTYANQQISHVALDSAGSAVLPTENIGKATIRGVEGEIRFLATRNTLLSADLQYLDAKYNDFVYSVPDFGAPPSTTCPSTLSGVNYSVDCSGRRPPQAPKWTVNLSAEQTIDLTNEGRVVLSGRMHYQSKTLTSLEFLPEEEQKAYATFDAAATYHAPANRYFVTAFVNNLTNRTVMAGSFLPPFSTTSFAVGILRPPRTYGVRLGFDF
ncbi:TonB-dependent receptor [Novosphingobium sp. RL4]|uniref:TonB-dependent receptor n=1 Tax=Novosphingobium sp. RL4 TaxID=3109595 RepID=UPI002D788F2B|nr:TonB-dependent receptor [Novosphingobium sp. RL4]WRT94432.1 TonB-dependent receptor [Novosphingobium sp. RL4]